MTHFAGEFWKKIRVQNYNKRWENCFFFCYIPEIIIKMYRNDFFMIFIIFPEYFIYKLLR